MDLASPASWADAHLDDPGPRDRAPILAIQAALAERTAVGYGGTTLNSSEVFADPAGAQNPRVFATAVVRCIRELRKRFFNPATPLGSIGWTSLDTLDSSYRRGSSGGCGPYDLLARLPVAPSPAPGDSTVAAATRAFYAWARDAIDAMTVVPATRWRVAGSWDARGNWASLGDMLAAAERTENPNPDRAVGTVGASFAAGGKYDSSQVLWWSGVSAPDGISVCNPTQIAADARLVVRAITWPGGEWDDSRIACDWIFGGFGLVSAPGPAGSAVRIGAGEWGELVPVLGSCPSPGASPPAWPGPVINWDPPAGGGLVPLQTWNIGCEVSALLDYTPGFRFKADEENE